MKREEQDLLARTQAGTPMGDLLRRSKPAESRSACGS
jgi:hypothetical protein